MKTRPFESRRTQHPSAAASREDASRQSGADTAADPRRRLQAGIDRSPRVQDQRNAIQAAFGHALQRRSTALQARAQPGATPPALPNQTGMPDSLRTGMESLSGLDMSDVRVHRNSGKPAQLNALAFAQGNDIHLAPGQEQHLPHEAWHVVQQRQGRVRPTVQVAGVQVNDDSGLEREADAMGAAAQLAAAAQGQDGAARPMTPAPHAARASASATQRYVDVEDPTTWLPVRRAEADELARYLTPEGGQLTPGQVAWAREVTARWGSDYQVRAQLLKAQVARASVFSIPEGQPNSAAVAVLSWLEKDAPTTPTSPVPDESARIDFDAREPATRPVLHSQPRTSVASADPVKVKKSTINFSESVLRAAPLLGLGSEDLESRNPHTKLGTGSSGTQHDVADAKASVRAKKLVEGAILAKTGAHMSAQDFLKQQESAEVTRIARDEKKSAAQQKRVERNAADWEDFCSWIAVLAPKAWRDLQEQRGNTVRKAPPEKKHKALLAKATKAEWPLEWDSSLAQYLEG